MTVQETTKSTTAFTRASASLVGGVNSPVRAFKSVGGTPRFVKRAEGSRIYDIDGNSYIDLVGSWGPAIVGHAHPHVVDAVQRAATNGLSFGAPCEAETELAELILGALPSVQSDGGMLRFVNSGTEAGMSTVRLARAATSRPYILKFKGNYHGHTDGLLVEAGSGAATFGVPNSAGVPEALAQMTLLADFNSLESVEQAIASLRAGKQDQLAAILVEPIAGNMGFIEPESGFLKGLRDICDRTGAMLVYDEVMTGFRTAWGGVQCLNDLTENTLPDITCLGKVIGGGMPVAAYCGRKDIMKLVAPLGPMYQAGTLSGNPVGMAAGKATLELCQHEGFYDKLAQTARALSVGLQDAAKNAGIAVQTGCRGGMVGFAFADAPLKNMIDADNMNHDRYAKFFHAMLDRGVWLPPSSYEAWFISAAHSEADVQAIIAAAAESFAELG